MHHDLKIALWDRRTVVTMRVLVYVKSMRKGPRHYSRRYTLALQPQKFILSTAAQTQSRMTGAISMEITAQSARGSSGLCVICVA